jgi:uncharacterized membrane protein
MIDRHVRPTAKVGDLDVQEGPMDLLNVLLRWLHVVFGIIWIGHLYFFNFVNIPFQATMDGETKKKVNPELLPRALFWFRWGAAFTWVTGVLLLLTVFYHGQITLDSLTSWGPVQIILALLVFAAPFIYDPLCGSVFKNIKVAFWGGWALASLYAIVMALFGFTYRSHQIHVGAMFGTIMAFNVWFRIWPAQQKIITAVKNGEAPDAALVALAGTRSRHNTYMSVPLVFFMLNQHNTFNSNPSNVVIMILIGWALVYHLYDRSAQVKGF